MSDEWVLAGRYRVDAPIGSGGMGEVWRGYDLQLDRRVAIKILHRRTPSPAPRPGGREAEVLAQAAATDRERFLREIRTTARLEHPGIPAVYDFGVESTDGRIYLVMQLLFGQTLSELAGTPMPLSRVAAIGAQIAATLAEVHRVDVVHRDIKPSNVMITGGGLVRLLDFGVAVLQGASALPRLTQVGQTVGSPPYMSREQALGNPVGPPTDVYALGCVLFELLTGRVPFQESASRSLVDHHINTPPPRVHELRSDVPDSLDALVAEMLAKEPERRPTAEGVYDALIPLIRASRGSDLADRDPALPFVRPLGPARRRSPDQPEARPAVEPLSIDEALELRGRVRGLVERGELTDAIELLTSAEKRAQHNHALWLEVSFDLATTLYTADEFRRAAPILDQIVPEIEHRDGADNPEVLNLLYMWGVSHAEAGHPKPAIEHLRAFLDRADETDPLYRDALYTLGLMLHAAGLSRQGIAELTRLRPMLVADYGEDSIHVRSLDRRIDQLRRGTT